MGAGYSNFRRSLNGFNRHDVISYIEKLAAERNSYKKDAEELQNKLDSFQEETENKNREVQQTLNARIIELEKNLEEERERSNAALLEEISTAEKAIAELRKEYAHLYSDLEMNVSHGKGELERASENLSSMSKVFEAVANKLVEIEKNIAGLKEDI